MNITKADFKLFIDWLKTKPADETYDYSVPSDCLIALYLKDMGHEAVSLNTSTFRTKSMGEHNEIPYPLDKIATGPYIDASDGWSSFGDALKRAKQEYKKMYGN